MLDLEGGGGTLLGSLSATKQCQQLFQSSHSMAKNGTDPTRCRAACAPVNGGDDAPESDLPISDRVHNID